MVDQDYPAVSQLIHTLVFGLEQIAWVHQSNYVVINPGDVLNQTNIIKELEY